jgi:phosphoglycolate phosphatase
VIFDLDGTLVDTVRDIAAALNHALAQHGLPPRSIAEVRTIIGEGARRLVEQALPAAEAARAESVLQEFLRYYRSHAVDYSQPYPGVRELLRTLARHGVVNSVLTNKPEELTRQILARLDLEEWFMAVCGGDTLPERKPEPKGVFYLCTVVGRSPGETLLVGDSGIDRATAEAAGTSFCAALWGYRPHEVVGCSLVAAHPSDVANIVLAQS